MESLLLSCRALSSPTTCRFIPAHSVPWFPLAEPDVSAAPSLTSGWLLLDPKRRRTVSRATMDHMCSSDTVPGLPPLIEERLAADDDPELWVEILRAAAEDASVLRTRSGSRLYAIVGRCSHWARPHQSRWTAAGGLSLPLGYGDGEGYVGGLPNLDWNVTLEFDPNQPGWVCPLQSPTKRFRSVRLAIPSRTARHLQAAVHAVWSPATLDAKQKRTVYYGLRKSGDSWKLVARSEGGVKAKRRWAHWSAKPSVKHMSVPHSPEFRS